VRFFCTCLERAHPAGQVGTTETTSWKLGEMK